MTDTDTERVLPDLSRPAHCVAVRAQTTVYDWENDLHNLARIKHPRCVWWWSIRRGGPGYNAHCYICGKRIIRVTNLAPLPAKLPAAVERHKLIHRSAMLHPAARTK